MQSDNTKAFAEMFLVKTFTLHKGPGKVRILGVQNIVQWIFYIFFILFSSVKSVSRPMAPIFKLRPQISKSQSSTEGVGVSEAFLEVELFY